MKHVMVDIETLGLKPSSTILSIGAVFFDIETGELGEEFYMNIDPEQGRDIDPNTVMWWLTQSSRARNRLVDGEKHTLKYALESFKRFLICKGGSENPISENQIWANGATFDPVLLSDAYNNNPPWKFWNVLDQRTMRFLDRGRTEKVEPTVAHDALSDAIAQAKYVSKVWQLLNKEDK
jgi:hypothetical protein